jgi:hypothetical protein
MRCLDSACAHVHDDCSVSDSLSSGLVFLNVHVVAGHRIYKLCSSQDSCKGHVDQRGQRWLEVLLLTFGHRKSELLMQVAHFLSALYSDVDCQCRYFLWQPEVGLGLDQCLQDGSK